jgi:hypothetical protein
MQLSSYQKTIILVALENLNYTENRPDVKPDVQELIEVFSEHLKIN